MGPSVACVATRYARRCIKASGRVRAYTTNKNTVRRGARDQLPFHDRDVIGTNCGCLCIHRMKIDISTVMASQKLGLKEVNSGIWLVGFLLHDLGYIDLEQKTSQTIDNPFGMSLSSMS